MSTNLKPTPFTPDTSQIPEVRIAAALEFIAARMSMMQYDTTMMRMEIMKLGHILGALASRGGGLGRPSGAG